MYKLVLYITLNFFNVSINESHTIFGERKSHVQDPENCSMLSCIYWQIEIKFNLFICHIEILTLLHYLWLKNSFNKSLYWPLSPLKEILNYSKILRLTLPKSFSWWFCLHLWVWGFCWKNYIKIHMFNQSSNFIHICCQMSCKPCAIQFIKVNMYLNIYYYMYIQFQNNEM